MRPKLPLETIEDRIVSALDKDIRDRRGLKGEWNSIGQAVMDDLLETWREIIRRELLRDRNRYEDRSDS